ncbi:hypothetical protein CVV43_02235 [Candidatus Saccharibacteria bacterium HGW-Saccharibacteria-1]|nr:MAG: hypothetical protein CVV43_02235 [Candidatus Saccharibacteria bacterium HGW-Saccharibacteria-1]
MEISEADGSKYKLTATKGTLVLTITDNSGLTANDPDWVTIGTQKWARKNLNVGVMIDGSQYQTNNSLVEKNCYDNLESNCTKYGGLYQWREMMAYVPDTEAEGTRGVCPVGSHVPTELEWKALFTYLGGIEIAGMKLSSSGGVGFDMMFGGMRFAGAGGFHEKDTYAYNWSSSHIVGVPWNSWQFGNYYSGQGAGTNLTEFAYDKSFALSVRCLKD